MTMGMLPNETSVLPMTNIEKPVMKGTTLSQSFLISNQRDIDKESTATGRRMKRKIHSNIMCTILTPLWKKTYKGDELG